MIAAHTTRNHSRPKAKTAWGFTIAELLIALLIIAEIATFTIPKVLVSQQNSQYKAATKEAIAAVSGAYQQLQYSGNLTTNTTGGALSPYLNYVALDTSTVIDNTPTQSTVTCSSSYKCLRLHNGGMLMFDTSSFGGSATTNAIWMYFDPDARVTTGTTSDPGKSVQLWLYYTGRISDLGSITPGSTNSYGAHNPAPTRTPTWFSW